MNSEIPSAVCHQDRCVPLRTRIEEAWDRGDPTSALRFSREIDAEQVRLLHQAARRLSNTGSPRFSAVCQGLRPALSLKEKHFPAEK